MSERIRGVLSPVITPFHSDLSVDFDRLITQCRWLQSRNVGLAVLGTNSEANSISPDERIQIIQRLVDGGINPKAMMPGTGACDLPVAVSVTKAAVEAGCAGVLMLPPFYYKGVSDEGLYRFYAEVIERVGDARLRIYLYHIPPVAQVGISPNLIERLLNDYPETIAGLKDSSGDWNNTSELLSRFADRGFDVFVGSERFLLQGLRNGAVGCISATANVNGRAIDQLYQQWQNSDADDQQQALNEVRQIFESFPMIPALKAATAHRLSDDAWCSARPPLGALDQTQRRDLIEQLNAIQFFQDTEA